MNTSATNTAPAGPSLTDMVGALRRRRWPMIIAAAIVLPIVVAVAMLWPAMYRSTATILIEQQEIPTDLVRSTISSFATQRLQVINQRVMTTSNLLQIVQKYDLYAEDRERVPREVIVGRMRESVKLNMISADVVDPRSGGAVKATIAFSLSFDSPSADTAAKVANELTTLYLNENIEARKRSTANTATFLSDEANRLGRAISDLEMRIATFKLQNARTLPEQAQVNAQLMTRVEEELRTLDAREFSIDQQVLYLDSQMAQVEPSAQVFASTGERILSPAARLKSVRAEYIRATALYSPDHPDVLRFKRELEALEKQVGTQDAATDLANQLREAQSQLASAQQRLGTDHPDIARLERVVSSLETAMRDAPVAATAVTSKPDNPVYLQLVAQREMSVNERVSLQQRRKELQARVADYEQRLADSPEVERAYNELFRELQNSRAKYQEVRQKAMEAELAQNLESESKGERFTLIEPPMAAQEPFSPNRQAIIAMGVVLAIVVAAGVMLVLEMLDTSVRSSRDLTQLLATPPLSIVPWMFTEEDRARQRRHRKLALAGAVGSVVVAVVAVHVLFRPLDVLWAVALRRLGS